MRHMDDRLVDLFLLKRGGTELGNVHFEVGSGVFVLKKILSFFWGVMHLQQCLNVI